VDAIHTILDNCGGISHGLDELRQRARGKKKVVQLGLNFGSGTEKLQLVVQKSEAVVQGLYAVCHIHHGEPNHVGV